MKTIKPKALKPGQTIGIMAPSSYVEKTVIENAAVALQKRGFNIYVHGQTFKKHHQSAGTGKQKAAAFHDLISNPAIHAIFCAKGGNGAATMLEHLDFDLIKRNPKIILGYSDISALLNPIHEKTGLVGFHGPMLRQILNGSPKAQVNQCFNLMAGDKAALSIPMARARTTNTGTASGKLIGGNLCILASLMGTPYEPDFKNTLLFLEDVSEEYSKVHRLLIQFRNAGALGKINGLIFGSFTDMTDDGRTPYGFKLPEIIASVTHDLKIPIVTGAPFGHGKDLYTLPIGHKATLTATKGKTPRLILDGPAVSL